MLTNVCNRSKKGTKSYFRNMNNITKKFTDKTNQTCKHKAIERIPRKFIHSHYGQEASGKDVWLNDSVTVDHIARDES